MSEKEKSRQVDEEQVASGHAWPLVGYGYILQGLPLKHLSDEIIYIYSTGGAQELKTEGTHQRIFGPSTKNIDIPFATRPPAKRQSHLHRTIPIFRSLCPRGHICALISGVLTTSV